MHAILAMSLHSHAEFSRILQSNSRSANLHMCGIFILEIHEAP